MINKQEFWDLLLRTVATGGISLTAFSDFMQATELINKWIDSVLESDEVSVTKDSISDILNRVECVKL